MQKLPSETSERSVQTFVRIRKKTIVILTAILLTVALLGGAFAIYVGNYYRANAQAIEAFSPAGEIEESTLDDGTLVAKITPKVDKKLGDINRMKERGQ